MDSKTLNAKIHDLCELDDPPYDAFGGKPIPYIGWFWRTVNFDSEDYEFGILPTFKESMESNEKVRLGFMEKNKWDYSYKQCSSEDWKEIKALLIKAVENPTHDSLKAVDDKIQSLITS
jgi:hypothetical protein